MRAAVLVLGFSLAGCTATLDFDGLAGGEPSGEPDCRRPESATNPECSATFGLEPGSVGGGIAPDWKHMPLVEIVDGFVANSELVIAVRSQSPDEGAVVAVDLERGDRRLVAGRLTDVSGVVHDQGSGSWLDGIQAIRPGPNGGWIALLWNRFGFRGDLVSLDPETGNRATPLAIGQACDAPGLYAIGTTEPVIGEDGRVWLAYQNSAGSDGALHVDQSVCERVELGIDAPVALAERDGVLWYLDETSEALGSYAATNGALTISRSTEPTIGSGDAKIGTRALAVAPDEVWTIGSNPTIFLSSVSLPSGDRAKHPFAAVSAQRAPDVWLHPDGSHLLLELDGAIFVVDRESGERRLLSY